MQPIEFFSALRRTLIPVAVIAPGQRLTFAELAAQTMRSRPISRHRIRPQARVCVGCRN
jgi:hypothetical protein